MIPAQLLRNKKILIRFIPEPAVELMAEWIYRYDFKLKIKKSRSSKYGDYRPPLPGKNHQITVNNDLNPYSFLLTLVHEIAHLSNFDKNGNGVSPHGREWKHEFRVLMQPFFVLQVFPSDVKAAVERYMHNPAATSCSDLHLQRTLKKYNTVEEDIHLESLEEGREFSYKKRAFVKGEQRRKRFLCREKRSGKLYLFSPLTPVILL